MWRAIILLRMVFYQLSTSSSFSDFGVSAQASAAGQFASLEDCTIIFPLNSTTGSRQPHPSSDNNSFKATVSNRNQPHSVLIAVPFARSLFVLLAPLEEMEMLKESRARDKEDGVDRNACIVDRNQFFNTQVGLRRMNEKPLSVTLVGVKTHFPQIMWWNAWNDRNA